MRTKDPVITKYLKERKENWVKMYKDGATYREIAMQYGVATVTVFRNLNGKVITTQ